MHITIPVFGMVKDEHHKTRALTDGENDISIAREQSVFVFVYGLQEEVHRYSVSRMDSAKRKTLKHSVLEKVSGIGPSKAKKYLKAAGSITAIKEADVEKLISLGIPEKDAKAIFEHFSSKQEN
jgi:excinuclease ABC subunit C